MTTFANVDFMLTLLDKGLSLVRNGDTAAFVTVVAAEGSTPRKVAPLAAGALNLN